MCAGRHRVAQDSAGIDPGLHDLAPVLFRIAAVDTAAGHVDDDVHALEGFDPITRPLAIPLDHAPWRLRRMAAEHGDRMSFGGERTGEQRSDLTRAARYENPHGERP